MYSVSIFSGPAESVFLKLEDREVYVSYKEAFESYQNHCSYTTANPHPDLITRITLEAGAWSNDHQDDRFWISGQRLESRLFAPKECNGPGNEGGKR